LACQLRRLFDTFGREIVSADEIAFGMELVASAGENFRPRKEMKKATEQLISLPIYDQGRNVYFNEGQIKKEDPLARVQPLVPRDKVGYLSEDEYGAYQDDDEDTMLTPYSTKEPEPHSKYSPVHTNNAYVHESSSLSEWETGIQKQLGGGGRIPADKTLRQDLVQGELEPEEIEALRRQMQKQQDALEQTKAKLHMHAARTMNNTQFPKSPTKINRGLAGQSQGRFASPGRRRN